MDIKGERDCFKIGVVECKNAVVDCIANDVGYTTDVVGYNV
jgi:hypothetical protein